MAKLFFRYASMNAGKSTELLQVAFNYEERKLPVALFTAALDNRSGVGIISSRIGLQREARTFDDRTVFDIDLAGAVKCVLVDEAQFLSPQQVRQLHRLANMGGVPVICFGIRSDFRGEPFPGSAMLLTLADDLQELKTICDCTRKASMNLRIDALGRKVTEGEQIAIGGNERYRAVCPACYYKA